MKEKVLEGDPTVANIRKHTALFHFQPADLAGIDWTGVDHLRHGDSPGPVGIVPGNDLYADDAGSR